MENGDELNGTVFNGVQFNGVQFNGVQFNGVQFNGVQFNGVQFNGVQFNGTDAGTGVSTTVSASSLVGMAALGMLSNGQTVQLKVDSSSYDGSWNITWFYPQVSLDGGASWGPLCAGGLGAVAVPELYDSTGSISQPAGWSGFSFACDGAALGKCAKWGYRPGQMRDECVDSTCVSRPLDYWHQACTRMVRADYCGNGVSHTRNGTAIDVYDNISLQSRWGVLGTLEADWTQRGARCIRHTRYTTADSTTTGGMTDMQYVQTYCPGNLAANDPSCGADPNTAGTDNTNWTSTTSSSVDWTTRHLLRNDSNTGG